VAWSLLDQYEPEVLILVAGANPVMRAGKLLLLLLNLNHSFPWTVRVSYC
jgi:hypothetical protein